MANRTAHPVEVRARGEWVGAAPTAGFDELRELCEAAGDKRSLAVGMAGLVMEHFTSGRSRDASRVASEIFDCLSPSMTPC